MKYDLAIIGAGVAGAFGALRVAENHKSTKTILFDLGKPPGKRRRQLEGWLGCFPTGDGKIYSNIDKIYDIAPKRKVNYINKWFNNVLKEGGPLKIIKDRLPSAKTRNIIQECGYELELNDYVQWEPAAVHQLSKIISNKIDDSKNIIFSFENEIYSILKQGNEFKISSEDGDYICKKVVLCVGRSGWRWTNNLYKNFGILKSDDYSKYGITIELSAQYMKDFNKSHCTLTNKDTMTTIGPLSWNGSVVQEDHADFTSAAFRSNEGRWKTDKVFFSIIKELYYEDEGCYQTDRLAKLAFLLSNDRVGRERIKNILNSSSQLSSIPEYNWLKDTIEEIEEMFPQLINRGYFHYPNIIPIFADINIGSNLETEVDGLYVAGESAGIMGLSNAAITGALAIDGALK
jgi:hypothetical protein